MFYISAYLDWSIEIRGIKLSNYLNIQAALAICGLDIRGFDYSRTQKPRITRDNSNFGAKLA